jgi:hypothetical protein
MAERGEDKAAAASPEITRLQAAINRISEGATWNQMMADMNERDRHSVESSERFYNQEIKTVVDDEMIERNTTACELLSAPPGAVEIDDLPGMFRQILLDYNTVLIENNNLRKKFKEANIKIWQLVRELLLQQFRQYKPNLARQSLQVGFGK